MIGLCVESSHKRGMGNLFRALNLVEWIKKHDYDYIMMVNDDKDSLELLNKRGILYTVVDLSDHDSNWERNI